MNKFILNENLFEDAELPAAQLEEPIEISTAESPLPGPEVGNESGVADMIMNLIKDELEAIQGYNDFLATIADMSEFEHMKATIEDINSEENKHIGELQTLLKTISPNVEKIEDGKEEAKDEMNDNVSIDSIRGWE